jgi:hypothetical protein
VLIEIHCIYEKLSSVPVQGCRRDVTWDRLCVAGLKADDGNQAESDYDTPITHPDLLLL